MWIAAKVAQDACHAKSNSGPTNIIYRKARGYFIFHQRNFRNFSGGCQQIQSQAPFGSL